jgi:hypothetical protein
MAKPSPLPVPKSRRISNAGRKRRGPDGVAVRALPRLTVRAAAEVLTLFTVAQAVTGRLPHEAFSEAVRAWVDALPLEARQAIERERRKRASS